MLREISEAYRPINFAQVSALLADVLPMYWESGTTTQDLSRQYAMWHEVLREYSHETVAKVAMDWVKNAKRKPTPADFLELCKETDHTPVQIKRLAYMASLPEPKEYVPDGKMNGDPIILAKIMRFAAQNNIRFYERDQMDYLRSGARPEWYRPVAKTETIDHMPSREDLLAQMPPDVRVQAVKSNEDWKR